MGLLDAIKGQLAEVVEWADMDDESIFYKWSNSEIKKGSELIIRPGQDAIFLYQGRVEGIFTEEGEYDIETKIIPFLSTLKGFKFGFKSGLRAEVLFVNTREFTVNWGTQNAINLPVAGLPGGMPIRAFGTFVTSVDDYGTLIEKVAGVQKRFTIADVKKRIAPISDQLLMKWIVKEGKDMFNIQANSYDIAKGLCAEMNEEFQQFGMKAVSYQIQSVSYPDNVREMQEKAAGSYMVGDVNQYTQVQMANSFSQGGGNGGSTAAQMAQMAAGMAFGQQMMNNMNGGAQQQAAYAGDGSGVAPKYCPNCGTATNGANYCPNCGAKLV